jgi:hypothetical protein
MAWREAGEGVCEGSLSWLEQEKLLPGKRVMWSITTPAHACDAIPQSQILKIWTNACGRPAHKLWRAWGQHAESLVIFCYVTSFPNPEDVCSGHMLTGDWLAGSRQVGWLCPRTVAGSPAHLGLTGAWCVSTIILQAVSPSGELLVAPHTVVSLSLLGSHVLMTSMDIERKTGLPGDLTRYGNVM